MTDKNNPPSDIKISCYEFDLEYFKDGVATYHESGDPLLNRGKFLRYKWDEESGAWVMHEMVNVVIKKKGFWASLVAWTGLDQVMETRWDCITGLREAA